MSRAGQSSEKLRSEIGQWISQNLQPDLVGMDDMDVEREIWGNPDNPKHAAFLAYEKASLEAGLVCPHWPEEFGGRGFNELQMAVLAEELAAVGMPRLTRGMGERLCGPSIIAHGTPEQRSRLLPRIISGEDRYCQGFSESGAGSDLAAVATRGVVEGDEIVITGEKIWTSRAHLANVMFLLCRTDSSVPKHEGISFVIVPMKDNGITISEIITMAGDNAFCQEFIEGARAPLKNVIGGLGGGWKAAMTTLGSERGAVAAVQHLQYEQELDELVRRGRELNRLADPQVRQELAWAFCQVHVMKATGERVLAKLASGEELGPEASLTKIVWSEYHRRLGEIAMDLQGADALVRPEGNGYKVDRWQKAFLSSRAETIFAGTSEVQRRIIAERVLGLPREKPARAGI
ncbi:alkylation response protein AidB-like acyl-CoA dehydrogenase [Arthrobacter ginsengisoli]|uniref:Alkylation response protein AidB-like acyl-CoA dehydrogenase n=1 Tax=Arthrobacter ginsengisoli TaxID=1356565 RepID=A0ABU1UIR3_9MICC|nr:acyl-CoA dehydrogenase family protein [Arthrobacter ginsengisoli]MDR7085031.1 alkylation response protein AidB-like acyl-CoA dehydrogenase [Arthrobacter ginsengisoli]